MFGHCEISAISSYCVWLKFCLYRFTNGSENVIYLLLMNVVWFALDKICALIFFRKIKLVVS